jgi:hypothetical protein
VSPLIPSSKLTPEEEETREGCMIIQVTTASQQIQEVASTGINPLFAWEGNPALVALGTGDD